MMVRIACRGRRQVKYSAGLGKRADALGVRSVSVSGVLVLAQRHELGSKDGVDRAPGESEELGYLRSGARVGTTLLHS